MVVSFAVPLKPSVPQAETRTEPRSKLKVFKVHFALVFWMLEYLLIKGSLSYQHSHFPLTPQYFVP